MRYTVSLLMLLAVLMTVLAPVHVSFASIGDGGSETVLMTLDVCNDGGTGTVASGEITFIHQSACATLAACCSVPSERTESPLIAAIFSSGIERPPQA